MGQCARSPPAMAVRCPANKKKKNRTGETARFAVQQQHLEGHVLKEVRSAVVLLGLVAAAGVNPNTNSGSVAVAPLKRE